MTLISPMFEAFYKGNLINTGRSKQVLNKIAASDQ